MNPTSSTLNLNKTEFVLTFSISPLIWGKIIPFEKNQITLVLEFLPKLSYAEYWKEV